MSNLHKDVDENNKHTALGFSQAGLGDMLVKKEEGFQSFEKPQTLPPCIEVVDGSLLPPSANVGDIYILKDYGIDPIHPNWTAGGNGVAYGHWVNRSQIYWYPRVPVEGTTCHDNTNDKFWKYDGTDWNEMESNATHTNEVTGATALTLDKTAISNRTVEIPVGADYILFGDSSDSGNLKKGLISDIASPDTNIYNTNGTLTAARTVTMAGFGLSFNGGQVSIKGAGATSGTIALLVENSSGSDSLRVDDAGDSYLGFSNTNTSEFSGYITTRGAKILHLSSNVHTFRADSNNNNRGCAVFTTLGGSTILSIGTDSVGVNVNAYGSAIGLAVKHISTGSSFLFFDHLDNTVFRHLNTYDGDRFSLGRGMGAGTSTTDGIVNIAPSQTWGASIKIDSGVDPTGTNKSGGSIWYSGSKIKVQAGADTIQLYKETTGVTAAAFVANTSGIVDDTATFGGYTMGQVVAALKAQGLLA